MKSIELTLILVVGVVLGIVLSQYVFKRSSEAFFDLSSCTPPVCSNCNNQVPCNCGTKSAPVCPAAPPCREADLSKYVLKASIPPSQPMPDLSNYVLKSEIPPVPDMTKYVLKSSIPRQQPVILDCSKCTKPKGECPPCPRARCPEMKCPPPTSCPPQGTCPPCPTAQAPRVKCIAEEEHNNSVRPYLAPLSVPGFGAF